MLEAAGFTGITIKDKEKSDEIIKGWNFGEGVENMVFSAYVRANKANPNNADTTQKFI